MPLAPVKTASKKDSIWKDLDEDVFRRNIVALAHAFNDVPGDSWDYSLTDWKGRHPVEQKTQHRLSFEDEQRVADDLAYIAASKKSGEAISAVALEETSNPPENTESSCISSLFHTVVTLDQERLRVRICSRHKGIPLYQDLIALLPELRKKPATRPHAELLTSVCNDYQLLDRGFPDHAEKIRCLQKAVKSSFIFCKAIAESTDTRLPARAALKNKRMQQVGKIGRYWGLCVYLAKTVSVYKELFKNMHLKTLKPFKPSQSVISTKVPQQCKTVRCYVHAEIQLVIFYGMTPSLIGQKPRAVGVSKAACYLCNLFIKLHDQYFISYTHGRLYDQWTLPDLIEFSPEQRQQYRSILQEMNRVCNSSAFRKSKVTKHFPPESSHDIHANALLSPPAASTVTGSSSQITIKGLSLNGQLEDATAVPQNLTIAIPRQTEIGSVHDASKGTSSIHQSLDVSRDIDPSAVDGLANVRGPSPSRRAQVPANDPSNVARGSVKELGSVSVNVASEETSSNHQSPRVSCAQSKVDEPEDVRQPSPSTQIQNITIKPEALAPGSVNEVPGETSSNRQSPRVSQSMIDEAEHARQPSLSDRTPNTAVNPNGPAPDSPTETESRSVPQLSEIISSTPEPPRASHDHSLGNGSKDEDLEHSSNRLLNASSDVARISAPISSSSTDISVSARNLPRERTLSQHRPCSFRVQGIHVYFEAEEATRGRVTAKKLPNDAKIPASAINVDAMAPGDVVDLHRDNAKSILHLDLYRSGHQSFGIDLEWLLPA
ncbi:MAG: hypothetical protein Q9181_004514 [Wetmoreana brouardii]